MNVTQQLLDPVRWSHDAQGRLDSISDPLGNSFSFPYHGVDSVTTDWPAGDGRDATLTLDNEGHPAEITDPDTTSIEFGYDADDRLTSRTSKLENETTFSYDWAGLPAGSVLAIDMLTLTAPVTDHDAVHERNQEVVKPLRLRSLLEGDVDRSAQPAEELGDCFRLRGQDGACKQSPRLVSNRYHRGILVNVHRHVLRCPFHESRSLPGSEDFRRSQGAAKGRALNMRKSSCPLRRC